MNGGTEGELKVCRAVGEAWAGRNYGTETKVVRSFTSYVSGQF